MTPTGRVCFVVLEGYDVIATNAAARFTGIKPGELLFCKKDRAIDWNPLELEKADPPDGIFSLGKWLKGEELFKKKQFG